MQWVKCTDHKSGETIYVNLANAMSIAPGKRGGTIIAFAGGKNDYVAVTEEAGDLIEADHHGHSGNAAKSCPCGSHATADHASS